MRQLHTPSWTSPSSGDQVHADDDDTDDDDDNDGDENDDDDDMLSKVGSKGGGVQEPQV